jgi:UDP-N-acetylmuramoyl-L-alanyl-D-glutamate--2,6-diaminopimelate ligase
VQSENRGITSLRDLGLISDQEKNVEITGLSVDSKKIENGFLFIALNGSKKHGAEYTKEAIRNGASAVLTDKLGLKVIENLGSSLNCPCIISQNPRLDLSKLSRFFWNKQPETMIAVTGTNGKTSVTNFVRQIWSFLGYKSVNIGTNGVDGDYYGDIKLTTPEPITLHKLLHTLSKNKISHCSMEASSHGLSQYRLDAVNLCAAAFTNFSHDHLDYHKTFDDYFESKMRLFEGVLSKNGTAVIFTDNDTGEIVKNRCDKIGLKTFTIGSGSENNIIIDKVKSDQIGQTVRFKYANSHYQFRMELVGRFQVNNVLMALSLAIVLGEDVNQVKNLLHLLKPVPGRMQLAGLRQNGAPIFVDYAHTPDALMNALVSLRQHVLGRLIVIFGAGGDRDQNKRVLMGRVASQHADVIYVTDDNPRGEDPQLIRNAILAGCPQGIEIGDRAEAILVSVAELKDGDALLIAGKGHETDQIIGDMAFPFNDIEQASMAIEILDRN